MKKLLLINPVGQRSGGILSQATNSPPLGLAYVAAVTPSNWEVKIIDENIVDFTYEEADLVGVSAFTSTINRAYDIARLYREKGIKVVMGGIHPSMLPEESLQFADAVVVGEVEMVWSKIIDDFENRQLNGRYIGPQVDFDRFDVMPRHDLIDPSYKFRGVITSRGCPFNCNFCTVTKYLGSKYRQRKPENVLRELELLANNRYIFFQDDNLVGYRKAHKDNALKLFRGMLERGLKKRWFTQISVNVAQDEEVIKAAAEAGCMFVFIGFESLSPASLRLMRKNINLKTGPDNYRRVVDAFHKHGVGVVGSFMIGNDYESPKHFRHLAGFLVRSKIDAVQMTITTPLPGTAFMKQMQEEDRLLYKSFPEDWAKYRLSYVTRKIKGVDSETVYRGNNYIKNHIYKFPISQYRALRTCLSMRNMVNSYGVRRFNAGCKRGWMHSYSYRNFPKTLPETYGPGYIEKEENLDDVCTPGGNSLSI